tara:strand:- start:759 stop:1121 length:363 start_codon:yes stop_codon:yes gene_type:complete
MNDWEYIILTSAGFAVALLIWFQTNAFVEYARLFGFKRFLKNYEEDERMGISFPDYLLMTRDCFFFRLISCPICLGAWLSLSTLLVRCSVYTFSGVFYLSLILYFSLLYIIKRTDVQNGE